MARIQVEPGELNAASGRQSAAASQLLDAGSRLQAAAQGASAAAGEPGLTSAIAGWGAAWTGAIGMLAMTVGGTASNLGAAAGAYAQTDERAMPQGAPRN